MNNRQKQQDDEPVQVERKEPYHQPLLIKHGKLVDLTGTSIMKETKEIEKDPKEFDKGPLQ